MELEVLEDIMKMSMSQTITIFNLKNYHGHHYHDYTTLQTYRFLEIPVLVQTRI